MKRLLGCMLIGALALTASACGSRSEVTADTEAVIEANEMLESAKEEQAAAGEAAGEEQAVEADTEIPAEGEVSTDKIVFFDEEAEEAAEEETQVVEAAEAADVPDLSQAVDGSSTTETEPAPLGSWVKTALYATQDSTYHTAYVRIVRVTTQSADPEYVESAIAANDGYGEDYEQIDPAEMDVPDDGELVVLDYEVYVPADFPAPGYGMTEPKFYFSVRNIGGGGFPNLDGTDVYLGMGTTREMVVRDSGSVYEPGNTYGERCIYAMVQGYTGYVATYSSYPEGTTSEQTDADRMYTVYHAVS